MNANSSWLPPLMSTNHTIVTDQIPIENKQQTAQKTQQASKIIFSGHPNSAAANACDHITTETKSTIAHNFSGQRKKFRRDEDIKLSRLIALNGPRKWDQIAQSMPGRTGRQCRDRFHNYLNPALINGPWSVDEDRLLIQKVYEYGQHWNKIAKFFIGRSHNNIKNRWYSSINKQKNLWVRTAKNTLKNFEPNYYSNKNTEFANYNLNQNNEKLENIEVNGNNSKISAANDMKSSNFDGNTNMLENNSNNNNKKVLFPLLNPSDDSFFGSLNEGIFNFFTLEISS